MSRQKYFCLKGKVYCILYIGLKRVEFFLFSASAIHKSYCKLLGVKCFYLDLNSDSVVLMYTSHFPSNEYLNKETSYTLIMASV